MKIKKFNESLTSVNLDTFSFFDLIVEKVKTFNGWTVFSISKEENFCQTFNFPNEQEFLKEFSISKHPIYPGSIIIPKNVEESEQRVSDVCIINGQEFYLETTDLYLVVDGKLIR